MEIRKKNLAQIRRRKLALTLAAAMGLGINGLNSARANDYFADTEPTQLVNVQIQDCCPPAPVCPPGWTGVAEDGMAAGDDAAADTGAGDTVPPADLDFTPTAPTAQSLVATSGTGGGLDAPGMIGDFIGPQFNTNFFIGPGLLTPATAPTLLFGVGRRFKISENVSPIPQDRFIFNYHHYHNGALDPAGNDVNIDQFTVGLERTFADGLGSFEVRLPFASALDSTLIDDVAGQEGTELGNLQMALKLNLCSSCNHIFSGGTTFTVPTGDDFVYLENAAGNNFVLEIENESYHIAPFLGLLVQPNRDWFYQGYVQVDFDLNGNGVRDQAGAQGELQDQTLLFLDGSIGNWLYRSNSRCDALHGIAAMMELHYTTTLEDTDIAANGIRNVQNRQDFLNLTGALNFAVGESNIRVGASAPLRNNSDQPFDTEILVQWNRFL